jgi:hypothetical protein
VIFIENFELFFNVVKYEDMNMKINAKFISFLFRSSKFYSKRFAIEQLEKRRSISTDLMRIYKLHQDQEQELLQNIKLNNSFTQKR